MLVKFMFGTVRGLLYEPTYENEVILLFGLLIPYLKDDFVIDQYSGSFPDCIARRNGEEIGIEFEVLASDFYDHGHDEHPDLAKCKLLVCWKNDLERKTIAKDGKSFIIVNGYEIEVLALDKIVSELRKKGIVLIMDGERPDIGKANEDRFFKQLEENVDKQKFEWIKKLYDEVSQRKEFEVKWGRGRTWFTMRFFVKEWNVDPIMVQGDGRISIGYTGNPAINPWELPQETQKALRQLFKHKERERWPTVPLNSIEDLNKIEEAIKIIAENSKRLKLQWQNET
jgi:hypothetical protein